MILVTQELITVDARDETAVKNLEGGFGSYGEPAEVSQAIGHLFRIISGDRNPIHWSPEAAAKGPFGVMVAPGKLITCMLPRLRPPPTFDLINVGSITQGPASQSFSAAVPWGKKIHAREKVVSTRFANTDLGRVLALRVKYEVYIVDGVLVQDGYETLIYPVL